MNARTVFGVAAGPMVRPLEWSDLERMRAARRKPAAVRFAVRSPMAEARAALAVELAPVLPIRPFGVSAEALAAVSGPNPFDKSAGMQRPAPIFTGSHNMLATRCGICGQPLRDPVSVELGIGPICRDQADFKEGIDPAAYERAKVIVFRLELFATAERLSPMDAMVASDELQTLGFGKLADVILKRNARVVITDLAAVPAVERTEFAAAIPAQPASFRVKVPADQFAAWELKRAGAAVEVDKRGKVTGFRFEAVAGKRGAVWSIIERRFRGVLGVGPRGPFMVGAAGQIAA